MATHEDKSQDIQDSDLETVALDAPLLSIYAPDTALSQDVQVPSLSLSEDESGQEEKPKVRGGKEQRAGLWTFEFYQSLFNVDTMQVLDRIRGSLMPLPGRNFVRHCLHNNPDLYGPLWICTTLVFSLAINGNLSTLLDLKGNHNDHYRLQFHKVSVAAVAVFLYVCLVPLSVWGFLKWRQGVERQTGGYSYLETVLWITPFKLLHLVSVLVATAISSSVLAVTFWPSVCDDRRVVAIPTVLVIALLHVLLAVGCKSAAQNTVLSQAPPSSNSLATLNSTAWSL
ncbi:hypothetical protein JZ751_028818 [Albula glossodonta]|uniref:Protein YIPF n=1 Tax=Albula glossodonta TaxID=121402 RepID=A0A8T2NLX2_9TELE|nr:hypothetical protein JZ751_028818 [Albula glossodonta]